LRIVYWRRKDFFVVGKSSRKKYALASRKTSNCLDFSQWTMVEYNVLDQLARITAVRPDQLQTRKTIAEPSKNHFRSIAMENFTQVGGARSSAGVNGNEWFNDSSVGFGQVGCIGRLRICAGLVAMKVSTRGEKVKKSKTGK